MGNTREVLLGGRSIDYGRRTIVDRRPERSMENGRWKIENGEPGYGKFTSLHRAFTLPFISVQLVQGRGSGGEVRKRTMENGESKIENRKDRLTMGDGQRSIVNRKRSMEDRRWRIRIVQNRFPILRRLLGLQPARGFLFPWITSKRYKNSPLSEGMSALNERSIDDSRPAIDDIQPGSRNQRSKI